MALTKSQLAALAVSHLGDPADVSLTDVKIYVDWALTDISRPDNVSMAAHIWRDLRKFQYTDTVDGQKTYALPDTLDTISGMTVCTYSSGTYSGEQPVTVITGAEAERVAPVPETHAEGKPRFALWWSRSSIDLLPIPDAAYRLYMRWVQKAVFADDNAVSPIAEIDDLIVLRASYYGFVRLEEKETYEALEKQYVKRLRMAVDRDRHIPSVIPSAFRSRGFRPDDSDPFYRGTYLRRR